MTNKVTNEKEKQSGKRDRVKRQREIDTQRDKQTWGQKDRERESEVQSQTNKR